VVVLEYRGRTVLRADETYGLCVGVNGGRRGAASGPAAIRPPTNEQNGAGPAG
jgi:hypothetical protein